MLDGLRTRIARWLAPAIPGRRTYGGARQSRLSLGFGGATTTSADSELLYSLTALRSGSRQLLRDSPYAKRAQDIVVNNVIGTGIGFQAQVRTTREGLHDRVNSDIEATWDKWARAETCHTGGALAFGEFERSALAEVFAAGEVFIRLHRVSFGGSDIPLALELIEGERIAEQYVANDSNQNLRLGVEVDAYGRALAYLIRERHPGDYKFNPNATDRVERVPASEIIHLKRVDRWPQTRGAPWMHPVLKKLNDMSEYSAAELTAARLSANIFGTLESDGADPSPLGADEQSDGSRQLNMEPGVIEELYPGEKLNLHAPNRPNQALDPFLRHMLREVAAGLGVSYESLSRDYSQSNYSSSRLALLDDRDGWRALQAWWVESFREPLHREWLRQAVLSRSIASISIEAYAAHPEAFEAVNWKCRGWSWVDPTKEVQAYKEAVRCGFTTVSAVIRGTGGGADIEDVIAERARELRLLDEAEIEVDTTVVEEVAPQPAQPAAATQEDDTPARVLSMVNR